ncbi:MAG TPA: hypothetical protein VG983_02030 [Caulobacterales bacterium]|jgi:hypothetical protein|nr:hypothetical protein [Caulobacterales bacterium]
MRQALSLAFLEGIAVPGIGPKAALASFGEPRRPIEIDAAEIAASAAIAAMRVKRGVK